MINPNGTKMVNVYPNVHVVQNSYANRKPLSLVPLNDNSFWVLLRGDKMVEISCGHYVNYFGGAS